MSDGSDRFAPFLFALHLNLPQIITVHLSSPRCENVIFLSWAVYIRTEETTTKANKTKHLNMA